jgi:hypothetical protein
MTQEELLKAIGLSAAELRDLQDKFHTFFSSLNKHQQAVVKRSLPTIAQSLAALRPDVTERELEKFFQGPEDTPPIAGYFWKGPPPNP